MARFKNRTEAGELLAKEVKQLVEESAVVLALPRGGVPVAAPVASILSAPLSLIIARKVGHPQAPEYAICAVTEDGTRFCNESETAVVDDEWLEAAVDTEVEEATRRREHYGTAASTTPVAGKTVVVVEDGVATGLTLKAALHALKKQEPSRIVVAVPVAPRDTLPALKELADEVVVLESGEPFLGGVGNYYDEFPQTTDEEVIALLKEVNAQKTTK